MRHLGHRPLAAQLLASALPALLLCGLANTAAADDPNKPRLTEAPGVMDPAEEMTLLFGRVERRLRRIDALLMDASQGDASALSALDRSGLGDLLLEQNEVPQDGDPGPSISQLLAVSRADGREVLTDIDRILEIARDSGNGT